MMADIKYYTSTNAKDGTISPALILIVVVDVNRVKVVQVQVDRKHTTQSTNQ